MRDSGAQSQVWVYIPTGPPHGPIGLLWGPSCIIHRAKSRFAIFHHIENGGTPTAPLGHSVSFWFKMAHVGASQEPQQGHSRVSKHGWIHDDMWYLMTKHVFNSDIRLIGMCEKKIFENFFFWKLIYLMSKIFVGFPFEENWEILGRINIGSLVISYILVY